VRLSRSALLALPLVLSLATPLAAQVPVPEPVRRVQAPAPTHRFGWVLDATFEFGGDDVAEILFDDGSTQTITAGQGGTFSFGAEYRPVPRLGLRGTLGWKFATSAADNVTVMFTRIPIEAVASWSLDEDWRIGAGLAHHASINFDFDGLAPNFGFDPATGATLELGWRWAALTYTAMQYTDEGGNTYDAGAVGISLSYVFGKR
jgi:hypothetical protein